jgi:type VI secretion system secreted protein Hcp
MAVDFFLKLDGIKGESRDKAHAGQIDVLSWSWGASNSAQASGGGAGAGKTEIQDLHVVMPTNLASVPILRNMVAGKHIPTAYLYARKAGITPFEYLQWTLEDVVISSYQMGGSDGQDITMDQLSLNFAKMTVRYTSQDPDGSPGVIETMTWDLAESKAT